MRVQPAAAVAEEEVLDEYMGEDFYTILGVVRQQLQATVAT
jgi:hypothetical protein